MIDMHNHTLYAVDDGPKEIEMSVQMLKDAYNSGITDIILTPHYRKRMFKYDVEVIEKNFEILKTRMVEEHVPIRLYLGCEYHVNEQMLEHLANKRVKTLAGSKYVLAEFKYESSFDSILESVKLLRSCDYYPIIAHVERYECLLKKPKLCLKLQDAGAIIQCNANAVIGLDGRPMEKMVLKCLKHEWVDMIASDSHNLDDRANHLADAQKFVAGKYGYDYAKTLFEDNPGIILRNLR